MKICNNVIVICNNNVNICKLGDGPCFVEQMGDVDQEQALPDANITHAPLHETEQNVEFLDYSDLPWYDFGTSTDPHVTTTMSDDVPLDKFFARPIVIRTQTWGTGVVFSDDILPWNELISNPRVINRMSNFKNMTCTLRIRIVINGNSFQYGRLMVSYLPANGYDTVSVNSSLIPQDRIQASQKPHIILDPTTSTGGELTIPMFIDTDTFNLASETFTNWGSLEYRELNPLKHASGATDKCTITTFAWLENVKLSIPTSKNSVLMVAQMGEVDEANAKGVVSGPATSVSRFAALLKGIPYIGPYAKATEIGAMGIAKIAAIFGYCRPAETRCVDPVKQDYTSSLALTNIPDRTNKLSLDHKQELTIDPRIAHICGDDGMNIASIASRESYLTSFQWNITTATVDTLLWNCGVTPMMYDVSGGTALHLTPSAAAVVPFTYWRGTMNFRFQFVCSAFHRGRVAVVYDPHVLPATPEYNVAYTKIVDIAEEQDVTFSVGWCSNYSYLPTVDPTSSNVPFSTTLIATAYPYHQGVIGLYVVNELTTPDSTVDNSIEVNVFTSMSDDFEVGCPNERIANFTFIPQMGELEQARITDGQATTELDMPVQSRRYVLAPKRQVKDGLTDCYFGESIQSLRTWLKRYVHSLTLGKELSGPTVLSARLFSFPMYRGPVGNAVHTDVALNPYNFVDTVPIHWVTMMFQGWRGSIRWKVVPKNVAAPYDVIQAERSSYRSGFLSPGYSVIAAANNLVPANQDFWASISCRTGPVSTITGNVSEYTLFGANGMEVVRNEVNGAMEIEVPYYSSARFTVGKTIDVPANGSVYNPTFDLRIYSNGHSEQTQPSSSYAENSAWDLYCAIGEDFQTYFFTGLPRVYWYPTNPLSS